jgi:hypothetical protein
MASYNPRRMVLLKDVNDPKSGPRMHTLRSSSEQDRLLEKLMSLESLIVKQSHSFMAHVFL